VLAFAGFGRKADVENRSNKLQEILRDDKEWRAVADAPVLWRSTTTRSLLRAKDGTKSWFQ